MSGGVPSSAQVGSPLPLAGRGWIAPSGARRVRVGRRRKTLTLPCASCDEPPSPASGRGVRTDGLSPGLSRRTAFARVAGGACRQAGAADSQGPRIRRALPVPQREDAVVLRCRGQGFFSLLRLRRAWRRDRLSHAGGEPRFYRGDRAAGRPRRGRGAAADAARTRTRTAPEDAARSARRGGEILRRSGCGRRPAVRRAANIWLRAGSTRRRCAASGSAGPARTATRCAAR